jgi:hypothetical protein
VQSQEDARGGILLIERIVARDREAVGELTTVTAIRCSA